MNSLFEPEYRIFIDFLREKRSRAAITQNELADQLGIQQSDVSKYEHCQKRLDIIEVRNICNVLKISFPEFIAEFEKQLQKMGY